MPTGPLPENSYKAKSFLSSVSFAWNGLRSVLKTERNFRTHVVLAFFVAAGGIFFHVTRLEWILLILCMAAMMAIEALNTAIELLTDMFSEGQYSEEARRIKDVAAGACLLAATGIAIAGSLIFFPYLLAFFRQYNS